MSSEIYVFKLEWYPPLKRYEELNWSDENFRSYLSPKEFKQDILYCVGQMNANNNRCFLTFNKDMEPLVCAGDPTRYLFEQDNTHAIIHVNEMQGMALVDIFTNILPISAL